MDAATASDILKRMRADADRLIEGADPLLLGQYRALASRIDILIALHADSLPSTAAAP